MRYVVLALLSAALLFALPGCNKRVNSPADEVLPDSSRIKLDAFGKDNTLEVVTWNIRDFPIDGQQTVNDVKEIVRDLQADIFAVEEITDQAAFDRLLDSLPNYNGKLGIAPHSFALWTGVIYDTSIVKALKDTLLFTEDTYNFPRPPFDIYFKTKYNDRDFDFSLIVLHLKAYDEAESRARRKTAISKLKNYIDSQIRNGGDPDYIVVGDWNDELTDPETTNVFLPFLDDTSNYYFLTGPLSTSSSQYSYIAGSFKSLIDHILITMPIMTTYPAIQTQILKIDNSFNNYINEVSDHRPVGARIPVF